MLLLSWIAAIAYLSSSNAATLSGSFAPLSTETNINLSTEGTLDWVHWGLNSSWTVERKYGVAPQITNTFSAPSDKYFNFYDGPFQLTGAPLSFTWNDGTPEQAVTNTGTGVYIYGDKQSGNTPNGFQIQCPADTTLKQLRVYVGTSGATGTFSASLNGATTYTDGSLGGNPSNGVYTINFQADSPGQKLTINFTSTDTSGSLSLQAVTLSGSDLPPTVNITEPANSSVFMTSEAFNITATAADMDGTITNLSLLNGSVVIAQTNTSSLSVTLSNQPAGGSRIVAVATDDTGLSATSYPANIFVTTGGGVLRGSVATPPSSLDLTAEGVFDWAHWGLNSSSDFDHHAGISTMIPNVTPLNATTNDFLRYADNLTAFNWTNGTPNAIASGSTTGVYLYSTNYPAGAFQLTVPASPSLQRLKVYVGLYGDQARMDAWLSDSSAAAYTDTTLSSPYGNGHAVYTFLYSSTNTGATLNVRWSPSLVFDPYYGNITWQAATLSPAPPAPRLTPIFSSQPDAFNFSFPAHTGVNYEVWYSDTLNPANWQLLTNFPGTNGVMTVNSLNTSFPARFYRVQAE